MKTFADRNFLITGGASGIGLATAHLLKEKGAQLSLWDLNERALGDVAAKLAAHTAVVDVTQSGQVVSTLDELMAEFGMLHGLIHCAGVLQSGLFTETSLDQHRRMVEVNLFGSMQVAYAIIPYLKETRGSLILLGSTSAFYGLPEYASYGASKAGLLSFAQALRLELEPTGVHVGVVSPLFVDTPMIEAEESRFFKRFGPTHTAEEVANLILKGISRRRFMIWPGLQPAFFYWLSHVAYPFSHALTKWLWR